MTQALQGKVAVMGRTLRRSSENLANVECWRSQPLQGSAEPIRASVVAFALIDAVPHIAALLHKENKKWLASDD
jgi:hypothetical protein